MTHAPERDDADNIILRVGTSGCEILRADTLAEQMKPYAEFDEHVEALLRRDRAEATASTPLQRFGGSFGR